MSLLTEAKQRARDGEGDWETPVLEARKENSLPQHTLVCNRWKRSKGSQKRASRERVKQTLPW